MCTCESGTIGNYIPMYVGVPSSIKTLINYMSWSPSPSRTLCLGEKKKMSFQLSIAEKECSSIETIQNYCFLVIPSYSLEGAGKKTRVISCSLWFGAGVSV